MATNVVGYSSPVDIGLPPQPDVSDPVLYNALQPIHNALHILNQYLDSIRNAISGGDPTDAPSKSMPFQRYFYGDAGVDIKAGEVICPYNGAFYKGIRAFTRSDRTGSSSSSDIIQYHLGFAGIAIADAKQGAKVQVGIGPAIIEIPGVVAGQPLFARNVFNIYTGGPTGDGGIYTTSPSYGTNGGGAVVGFGIAAGYFMFQSTTSFSHQSGEYNGA